MPNRVIKESIRTSKSVNALNDFEFRLWLYLITYVDDYGRGSADPELLRGLVFPRRKGVTEKQIQTALDSLANTGMVILYEYDGEPFFYFPNWGKHQRIQQKHSKFPDPKDSDVSSQVTVSHGESPLESNPNRIQSESNKNINSTEPQSAPAVLTMPLVDGSEFEIREQDIEEWHDAFPNVDVLQQLKAMRLWCKDNPERKKTRKGVRRFITSWLDKEQNRGSSRGSSVTSSQPPKKPADASKREKGPDFLPEWAD